MKKLLVLPLLLVACGAFANTPPYLDPTYLTSHSVCALTSTDIFTDLRFLDDDLDPVSIVGITTASGAVFTTNDFSYNTFPNAGSPITTAYIIGTSYTTGTTNLLIDISDGSNVVTVTVGPITAIAVEAPVFLTDTISFCSNDGIVDLNQFVSKNGGEFYEGGLEINFFDGKIDASSPGFNYGDILTLSYDYEELCEFDITVPLVVYEAPDVSPSSTYPDCGLSNGSAEISYTGGTNPISIAWSTGEQNVTQLNNIPAGIYQAQVIDGNGCNVQVNFQLSSVTVDYSAIATSPLCYGQTNGALDVDIFGMSPPYDILWSSGHGTEDLANIGAGVYTGFFKDANGCIAIVNETVTQPDPLLTAGYTSLPTCGASDGTITIDYTQGGTAPYTYAWSNGGSGTSEVNLPVGIYSVTTTDQNSCMTINTFYLSESGAVPVYIEDVQAAHCGQNDGSIDIYVDYFTGQTITSLSWSNGEVTEDIDGLSPGTYVCTLVSDDGCISMKGWNVPVVNPVLQPICLVTVDSATTTNLVVWEPVQPVGIDYYKIYRETSTPNEFILIDTVQSGSLSVFNDVVASPQQRSWKYRISAVNSCGTESSLSAAHQTIHLDALPAGPGSTNVSWNPYLGTDFITYNLSRYTDADGWVEIAQLPASQLNYSDTVDITTPGLDYLVEFDLSDPCTAQLYKAQDFNSSRSNKEKGNFLAGSGTGASSNGVTENYLNEITVYPNPATSALYVAQSGEEEIVVEITSLTGVTVQNVKLSNQVSSLNISNLSAGAYIIKICYSGQMRTERIIKN